jgi:hypothetical protein
MRRLASWKLALSQVETFVFFAAMLLVITLEGACVYWLAATSVPPIHTGIPPANLVGQWTAATLPQFWLLGALLVLFYRISALVVPPQSWGRSESRSNRRSFVRLWCWTVALGSLQLGTLYLDRFTLGAH